MEFKELVYKRRSVRSYMGGAISGTDIRLILEAGLRAPNACNYQSWHLYCITDRAKIEALSPDIYSPAWIKDASAVIVITEDNTRLKERWGEDKANLFVAEDAGAAAQNMLLMASDLGYAGCFIGAFDEKKCCEFIGAGENERPFVMLSLGTYEAEPTLRDRKPFDEMVTFIGDVDGKDPVKPEEKPFMLAAASLPGAKFNDLNLAGAEFDNINLSGSRFTDINMTNVFFGGLCLSGAFFGCVEMQNATFDNPDLTGTEFKNCSFKDVNLENCDLDGMTIDGVAVKELVKKAKNS